MNDGVRKLPFGKQHSNKCFRRELFINAKISGKKNDKK